MHTIWKLSPETGSSNKMDTMGFTPDAWASIVMWGCCYVLPSKSGLRGVIHLREDQCSTVPVQALARLLLRNLNQVITIMSVYRNSCGLLNVVA